jgi:hypothetical protein
MICPLGSDGFRLGGADDILEKVWCRLRRKAIVDGAVIASARFRADLQLENSLLQRRLRELARLLLVRVFLSGDRLEFNLVGTKGKEGLLSGRAKGNRDGSHEVESAVAGNPGSPPHPMRPWCVVRPRAGRATFAFSG